jgi:hypothetical protein
LAQEIEAAMRSPPDHLWQRNNNVRYSPLAKDQDRLTVAENWAQIGRQADGILHFFVELASFWKLHSWTAHRGFREQTRPGPVAGS